MDRIGLAEVGAVHQVLGFEKGDSSSQVGDAGMLGLAVFMAALAAGLKQDGDLRTGALAGGSHPHILIVKDPVDRGPCEE